MSTEVKAFVCDFCPRKKRYSSNGIASRHEARCFYNPATKACATLEQLERDKLIKIVAIEPSYFLCEAADVPPIMRCHGISETYANQGGTPLKSTPNASAERVAK